MCSARRALVAAMPCVACGVVSDPVKLVEQGGGELVKCAVRSDEAEVGRIT